MNIINGIRAYVKESEFKITIIKDKINIVNYKDIGHFDSNKIIIKVENREVIIKGENLVVSKLMNDEILIAGKYTNIEFR